VGYYRITVLSSTRNSHLLACIDMTIVIFDYYNKLTAMSIFNSQISLKSPIGLEENYVPTHTSHLHYTYLNISLI